MIHIEVNCTGARALVIDSDVDLSINNHWNKAILWS